MVAMAKKSGLIICHYRSLLFLRIHFPSFFLEGEFVKFFSRFDNLEKLLSYEYSFIIFVMKLCAERETFLTLFYAALKLLGYL